MRMIDRQLQTAVNNILKWCDTNGHSISASKSCCVHFCRKRGIHPDPEIRIRDIQIEFDVRFLGVIFDRRLSFRIFYNCGRGVKNKPLEGVVKHLLGGGSNIITPSVPGNRTLSHRLRMCCELIFDGGSCLLRFILRRAFTSSAECVYEYQHEELMMHGRLTSGRLWISTVQQGFRYRVLLATKSRRNHRQRASGQRGKVGDDASAAEVPLSDMKRVIMHHIFKIWQESWSRQLDNKLHSVKPVIGAWPVMPMRRTDVKLTRLRIGHTRFTHRHLLFGERAPECPSCHVSYTVHHILIDCPVFNHHRITFFHTSILTLSDLVGESPHQNLFAFIKKIGFLYLI
ncbi:putative RNA-directed DNA polymerase from transposon BS [Trichonephila clavipes]|nr:putative RNA-directed DNA polymerase from transposon BS [Trichonephila clavipes]